MSNYVVPVTKCIQCICDHCNRLRCDRLDAHRFQRPYLMCAACQQSDRPPVLICPNFQSKQVRHVYRLKKLKRRKQLIQQRLDTIDQRLASLEDMLKKQQFNDMIRRYQKP